VVQILIPVRDQHRRQEKAAIKSATEMVMEVISVISLTNTVIIFSHSHVSLPLWYVNGDGAGNARAEV
ncbi:hypothetical protein A2U01_0113246, partial [Trifolium medium]|nr:hypothetical protein [Trifolium medium]